MGLTYYLPNISGITQYAVILAEELVKRKYKVEVICSGRNRNINNVKVVGINGFQINKGFVMPGYFFESFRIVKRQDVIICNLPSVESFWLALWGRLLDKKVIVIHHCEFNFTGTVSNKIISILTYPIHFFVYLWANTITSYTEDYAITSIFLKFFKNKIKYILPPIKMRKSEILNSKNRKKNVGFVGRIGWEKGLGYLIEAMKNVDAKLELIGPYKEVVGDNFYKKLKNIDLVGPIEHDKLNKYYEKFDCLVLPSINNLETFGIVQAEAMVCGTPVVASDLPGVRVPIQMTGMGEIANVADSLSLQKKISLVLKNGKKYYQNKARNLDQFDYRVTIDQYEKILEL